MALGLGLGLGLAVALQRRVARNAARSVAPTLSRNHVELDVQLDVQLFARLELGRPRQQVVRVVRGRVLGLGKPAIIARHHIRDGQRFARPKPSTLAAEPPGGDAVGVRGSRPGHGGDGADELAAANQTRAEQDARDIAVQLGVGDVQRAGEGERRRVDAVRGVGARRERAGVGQIVDIFQIRKRGARLQRRGPRVRGHLADALDERHGADARPQHAPLRGGGEDARRVVTGVVTGRGRARNRRRGFRRLPGGRNRRRWLGRTHPGWVFFGVRRLRRGRDRCVGCRRGRVRGVRRLESRVGSPGIAPLGVSRDCLHRVLVGVRGCASDASAARGRSGTSGASRTSPRVLGDARADVPRRGKSRRTDRFPPTRLW